MLSAFRRALETWPARLFFGLMVVAFVVWGAGNLVRRIGTTTWIARVGGTSLTPAQFNDVFERDLALAEEHLPRGQNVTAALRRKVADAALDQLIGQTALTEEIQRLRITVPAAAVRQSVFAMPAFQGPGGTFDRARLNATLADNGMSEDRFLGMVSGQIAQQQLVSALTAGVAPSRLLLKRVFAISAERRSALLAAVPFAAAAPPAAPDAASLRRFYANHPWRYRVPAVRTIKAAVLTTAALAKTLTITPAAAQTYYDAHSSAYTAPERRALQVLVLHDKAAATALAQQWRAGADWATMRKAAQAKGGSAVVLPPTAAAGLPDPDLATAAFAARPGVVTGPVTTQLGTDVLKVTQLVPAADRPFAAVQKQVIARMRADRAARRIYDVANQIDNVLGTGAGLSKLPGDVGLIGIAGTLDAKGMTRAGKPAPLPGPPALRSAILKAAFDTPPGQPPAQLTEVPLAAGGSAYFALTVEKIVPAQAKPFAAVKDQVAADWTAAQRVHEAEKVATRVLVAVEGGEPFPLAAAAAGLAVQKTPLVARAGPSAPLSPVLRRVLFSLRPGQPTMVQGSNAFLLAVPDRIDRPTPAQVPAQFAALQQILARSLAADVAASFATALHARAHPQVDRTQLDSFVNSGQ